MSLFNTVSVPFSVLKDLGRLALPLFLILSPAFAESSVTLSGPSFGKPPASSIGNEGNYFIDTTTSQMYGPKTSGQWPTSPSATPNQPGYNIVYSGPGGPPNVWQAIYGKTISGNLSSPDATGTTAPLQYYIGADTATGIGLAYMQVEGGLATGWAGGRTGIQTRLVINGVPSSPLGAAGVTGSGCQVQVNANLLGIAGAYTNYSGTTFGCNSQAIGTGNATFLTLLNAHEFDTELQASGSAAEKHAATFVATANDAVRATYDDSAVEVSDQNQSAPVYWKTIFQVGGYAHQAPSTTDTTLFGIQNRVVPSPATVNYGIGIDLSAGTAATAQYKGVGFLVDPNGTILDTSVVTPSMSAGVLAMSGLIAAPTLAANGEGVEFVTTTNGLGLEGQGSTYDVSLYDNAGAVAAGVVHGQSWFEVPNLLALGTNTFLTSGDILSISKSNNGDGGMTITNPAGAGNTAAFTAINIGNSTSPDEGLIRLNGGFFTGGIGANGLSIGVAAAGATLELGTGSEVLQTGSSAGFTANGSVATAMSSLGPTGSHATVQEWFTIKDSAGNVRYIPAF